MTWFAHWIELREMVTDVLSNAHPSECMSAATVAERVSDRLRGALWSPETSALLEELHSISSTSTYEIFTEIIDDILAELADSGSVERIGEGDAAPREGWEGWSFTWNWGGMKMAY